MQKSFYFSTATGAKFPKVEYYLILFNYRYSLEILEGQGNLLLYSTGPTPHFATEVIFTSMREISLSMFTI